MRSTKISTFIKMNNKISKRKKGNRLSDIHCGSKIDKTSFRR